MLICEIRGQRLLPALPGIVEDQRRFVFRAFGTLGCGRGPRQVPPGPLWICFTYGAVRFAARTLQEWQIRKLVSRGIN